jgi:hypothetical protein
MTHNSEPFINIHGTGNLSDSLMHILNLGCHANQLIKIQC